ncbi:hypothetical protein N0V82_001372 [Gnomoniopsis sp. IMI 355080]|nr:hypothetical protein N0V82_001372 [Gnomoniopsis sp. IMI 355080]
MRSTTIFAAALAATAKAAQDERTFAVLHFVGNGPLMEGRVDPIISPGQTSSHVHTFQGGSNIGISATGEDMMNSNCSTASVVGDNSAYWMPKVYFRDPVTGILEDVDLYYMNVYYFFEPTDDDVVAFPVGLQMVSGNASLRAGQGLPFGECDGTYSPLRHDLHFPSCYDPSKGLTDYKNNMAFPTTNYTTGKQNCPAGWTHVPHIFYEMYWDTPAFSGRWTPNQGSQPFLLANGDLSGCSGHGDVLAAWDGPTLQNIIDNCNAGDSGMDKCPGVTVRDSTTSCTVVSPIDEEITGNLTALPGDNPLEGWGMTRSGSNAATSTYDGASSTAAVVLSTASYATDAVPSTTSSSIVAQATTIPTTQENVVHDPSTATTLSTKKKCVHTVTVTAVAVDPSAAPAKRDDHGHAQPHAHAHLARHHSPHHLH